MSARGQHGTHASDAGGPPGTDATSVASAASSRKSDLPSLLLVQSWSMKWGMRPALAFADELLGDIVEALRSDAP